MFLVGPRIEKQELYCHNCGQYVQFPIDLSIDGNHVLQCPNCGHEHCRVVKSGKITDIRWDRRNGPTYRISSSATTATSTSIYISSTSSDSASGTGSYFLVQSWANVGT